MITNEEERRLTLHLECTLYIGRELADLLPDAIERGLLTLDVDGRVHVVRGRDRRQAVRSTPDRRSSP